MWTLLRRPGALFRFLTDARAPRLPQIIGLLTVLYVIMPVDLIPDVIPIVGWLDDIGLTSVALAFVASQAARYENAKSESDRDLLAASDSIAPAR